MAGRAGATLQSSASHGRQVHCSTRRRILQRTAFERDRRESANNTFTPAYGCSRKTAAGGRTRGKKELRERIPRDTFNRVFKAAVLSMARKIWLVVTAIRLMIPGIQVRCYRHGRVLRYEIVSWVAGIPFLIFLANGKGFASAAVFLDFHPGRPRSSVCRRASLVPNEQQVTSKPA